MLAQLIQAMYNIVDSFFVGKYSESALTALSAHLSVAAHHHCAGGGNRCGREYLHGAPVCTENAGTGGRNSGNRHASGAWNLVYICHFLDLLYASVCPDKCEYPGSDRECCYLRTDRLYRQHGAFLEGNWTKVHQSRGNMAPSDGRPDRGGADEYRA